MTVREFFTIFLPPIIAVGALMFNIGVVFNQEMREKEKFINHVKFDDLVLDTIKESKGATEDELYKKAMEINPKENAEYIKAMTSYSITFLRSSRLIERNSDKKYVDAMTTKEAITDYTNKNIKMLEKEKYRREILERVSLIAFKEPHKYTIEDVHKQIAKDINIDLDYFTMIVYEGMRNLDKRLLPLYPYEGYFIDGEGRLSHVAAMRAAVTQ